MRFLLFDLDGTLIVSGGAGTRSLNRAFFELYGIEDALSKVPPPGRTDPEIVRDVFLVFMGREPEPEEYEKIFERYLKYLPHEINNPNYEVLPGVKEFLERAKNEGFALGLATGNIEKGARIKLSPSSLLSYFSFGAYGSDSIKRSKLLKIAVERGRKIYGEPEAVYVVGDTPRDVEAAREAGFYSIAVANGFSERSELETASPDFLFSDMHDAMRFFNEGLYLNR